MHVTFDTLEMVRRLEAKGLKREQAEEIISVVKDVQQDLSTKQDIEALRKDTKADLMRLEEKIEKGRLQTLVSMGILMFTLLLAFKVLDKFL